MKKCAIVIIYFLLQFAALSASAAQVRVFVGEMNAVGVQNREELRTTLQTLLASRLNGDKIMSVSSASEADAVVSGTYIAIGKVFSIDAVVKTAAGKSVTRSYVQGENQDELIAAIGKLAEKLSLEISKLYAGVPSGNTVAMPGVGTTPAPQRDIIKAEQNVRQAPAGDFIKPKEYEQNAGKGWVSKRLDGALNLIAIGKTSSDGTREVFMAEERRLAFFRQANEMKLVAETEFRNTDKVLSLDTIDAGDGTTDIYVTLMRSEDLASQVWRVKDDRLVLVVDNLPYFFRSFSLGGTEKKVYAQAMGRDADFYGDIAEVTRSDSKVTLKTVVKLPPKADIYSFNQFRDADKTYTVTINADGYLIVWDMNQAELWRSSDKFGGSELFFQREDQANVRTTLDKYRWIFMNQRIQVTSKGEILVGKNDGFWILGNARKYKRGAVYCFAWNGSSLEEKWRTRDTQNYMPDFYYDEPRNELLVLQTTQRSGMGTRGASSLSIKKVE